MRQRIASFTVGMLALPATAAAVLGIFVALKPDEASKLISALYALGAIPLVVLVFNSAKIGLRSLPRAADPPADALAAVDWLVARIAALRDEIQEPKMTELGGKLGPAKLYALFAVQITYLVIVALAAPLID